MAYTTIDNPELYFQAKNYSGNASTNAITLDGSENMQPDMVWLKSRSFSQNHELYDSVRTATKRLYPNGTYVEDTNSTGVTAFNSDGFTLGSSNAINKSGETFASWNWKASGTSISNSSGSNGATLASAGIKNDTAGISIVTYTGDGNARTVFHGLSSCDMVIHKCLNNAENWGVQHKDIGAAYQLQLDTTIAKVDKSGNGSMALPAANVFSVNNSGQWGAARNYVAYAFRSVKGYSSMGSYTGNGEITNGAFVYLGFKPAFIMLKKHDAASYWSIMDNKRPNSFNTIDDTLKPNVTDAESDIGDFDFLSNGFKIYANTGNVNGSGSNYIYMAFAESPFVTGASAIPTTAR